MNEGEGSSHLWCGVIEGFYGRPWTTDQRLDLFQIMKSFGKISLFLVSSVFHSYRSAYRYSDTFCVTHSHFPGMNVYMYSPKDDKKHRAFWRDLYTPQQVSPCSYLISYTPIPSRTHLLLYTYCSINSVWISPRSSRDVPLSPSTLFMDWPLG